MVKMYSSLLCVLVLWAGIVSAQDLNETALPAESEIAPVPAAAAVPQYADTQTELWLKLQASGAIGGNYYTMPGQTATEVYQRYLKSFTYPIPQQFRSYSGMGGSSSSSGSSSGSGSSR